MRPPPGTEPTRRRPTRQRPSPREPNPRANLPRSRARAARRWTSIARTHKPTMGRASVRTRRAREAAETGNVEEEEREQDVTVQRRRMRRPPSHLPGLDEGDLRHVLGLRRESFAL